MIHSCFDEEFNSERIFYSIPEMQRFCTTSSIEGGDVQVAVALPLQKLALAKRRV